MGNVRGVTDRTFGPEVLHSTSPVLVDVWAGWCGPCNAIAPLVEALASEYEGQLTVVTLDVDANPHTASAYGGQRIPTLLVLEHGTPAERIVGAVPKPVIVDALQSVVA
jgi:thioredoxin 1